MRLIYLIGFLFIFFVGCTNTENVNRKPVVFDLSEREIRMNFDFEKYDSVYTNLLSTVTNDAEGDSLFNLWVDFNNELANIIKDNHFDWGSADSSVILWNRVYCSPEGNIEYYLYNVIDSTVSAEQKAAYGDFIQDILPDLKYPLARNYKYAQCGSKRHYTF